MQPLEELIRRTPTFTGWNHTDRIRFIGWYLHAYEKRTHFEVGDVRRVYERLSLVPPSNFSQLVRGLLDQKQAVKVARGIALDRRIRDELDAKYAMRPTTTAVTSLLDELPSLVPQVAEREFLDEAIKCFGCGAFRAAIVMTWNLTYDHLANWILKNHLAAFNAQWPVCYARDHAKAKIQAIVKRDDFGELKESQVIQICRSAGFITADLKNMLEEKLDKRNSAAHPSGIHFNQLQAEAFIDDLVRNVVLKLG